MGWERGSVVAAADGRMGYEHDSRLSAKGLIPSQDGERMVRSYFTDLKRSQVLPLYLC